MQISISYLGSCDQYFINGKSNGEKSRSLMTLHPSTFLHQSHDDCAGDLLVLWVVILFIQLQPILRIGPERVCKTDNRINLNKIYMIAAWVKIQKQNSGLPGKFLQPPVELPLTQRPSLIDTVQLFLSSPCSVSGVRLHISNFVKFLLKSSKDILQRKIKGEAYKRFFFEDLKDLRQTR